MQQYAEDILSQFHDAFCQQEARLCKLTKLTRHKDRSPEANEQFLLLSKEEEEAYQALMAQVDLVEQALSEITNCEKSRFSQLVTECKQQIKILKNPDFEVSRRPKAIFG